MICYKRAKSTIALFFMVIGLIFGYGIALMHLSSSLKIPNCGVSKNK